MSTATVSDLRNHYTSGLGWIRAAEEIVITQRGQPIARLVRGEPVQPGKVGWNESLAVLRDRSAEPLLSAGESSQLIHDAAGKW